MADEQALSEPNKPSLPTEGIKEEDIILITESSTPDFSHTIYSLEPSSANPSLIYSYANPSQTLIWRYRFSELPTYLRLPAEDIHVIISTKSGAEKAVDFYETVLEPVLGVLGLNEKKDYSVLKTESHESITQFVQSRLRERAAKGVQQTVLLLAGDGGVVDLVNGLVRFMGPRASTYVRPTVILFPLGTGNALFHSLHQPKTSSPAETAQPHDIMNAIRTLLRGSASPLPNFRTTFSPGSRLLTNEGRTASAIPYDIIYGAIVASYGLHSTLVADSDTVEWRKHGAKRFGLVANELLSGTPHAYKARVTLRKAPARPGSDLEAGQSKEQSEPGPQGRTTTDNALPSLEHGYVLLTLVSNLEKTFCISPASRPLDGALRIVQFGPEDAKTVGALMGAAYRGGKHVDMTDGEGGIGAGGRRLVTYEEVEGARVEFLERDEQVVSVGEEQVEGRWRRVCVDGLIIRLEEGGWMEVAMVSQGEEAVDIVVLS